MVHHDDSSRTYISPDSNPDKVAGYIRPDGIFVWKQPIVFESESNVGSDQYAYCMSKSVREQLLNQHVTKVLHESTGVSFDIRMLSQTIQPYDSRFANTPDHLKPTETQYVASLYIGDANVNANPSSRTQGK